MRLDRDVFNLTGTTHPLSAICANLRCGHWLVEAGSKPPRAHQPRRLLGCGNGLGRMAITLRSATLLNLNLGAALIARLEDEGCLLDPLAPLALHEILLNAAIHGNLGVSSGLSKSWSDLADRQHLIEQALENPRLAARLVTVALGWDWAHVLAVVADEGDGYNVTSTPAPDPTRRGAGRGLMIARAAAQVDVVQGGRCTRLIFTRGLTAPPS